MSGDSVIPATMRALQVSELSGDFSGCKIVSLPVPRPGPGEVLVKIRAASIGFPDLLMTRGEYQHKPELPFVPGSDVAGTVAALGDGVSNIAVGAAVTTMRLGGAFAEYGVYDASQLRKIPDNMVFAEASAFGAAYLTAYVSLVRRAQLQPGEWVLVQGASGGVGLAAVDLAKALGAKVIAASASDEKLARIRELYQPEAVVNVSQGFKDRVNEITGGGANVIYDPVGGDVFDESTRCIAFDGRLLVIGFTSGRIPTIAVNRALIKGFSVVGVRAGEYSRRFPERGLEDTNAMWRMAAEGKVHPHIHAVFPLSRWRDAFEQMQNRSLVGRVVIDPSLQ
jgi:NADPH2:quinone reductase